jgi:hypothetical protein
VEQQPLLVNSGATLPLRLWGTGDNRNRIANLTLYEIGIIDIHIGWELVNQGWEDGFKPFIRVE